MIAHQVAFLTGQSDPRSCGLSDVQTRFLRELPLAESAKVYRNFPYDARGALFEEPHLIVQSFNNTRQFIATLSPAFARTYRTRFLALLDRAQRTTFLAGSCGIQLLNAMRLPAPTRARVDVFAYGPVAFSRPACRHVLVGSTADAWSRLWFGKPDILARCNHLAYLEDATVARACADFLSDKAST